MDSSVGKEGGFDHTLKPVSQVGMSRSDQCQVSMNKSETGVGTSEPLCHALWRMVNNHELNLPC